MGRIGIMQVANESIDFQRNDPFVRELARCYSDIMQDIKDKKFESRTDLRMSRYKKEIDKLIFDRFGIKTNVDIGTAEFGMVNIFMMNPNHSFTDLADLYRQYDLMADQEIGLINIKSKEGTVDLEKAKVTGFFSEYKHDMWLGISSWASHGLTPMEGVAITIHEIGHAFTWYEYSDRLTRTNRVMSELTHELMNNNDPKKKRYILKELPAGSKLTDSDIDTIVNGTNRVIVGLRLLKLTGIVMGDQMGMGFYNRTTSEQMADNFATKFGVGKDLVTGLDKIYTYYKRPEKSLLTRMLLNFFDVILLLAFLNFTKLLYIGVLGVLSAPMGLALVVAAVSLYIIYHNWSVYFDQVGSRRESNQYMTYDHLKDRYTRVRQQIIQELKDPTLPKKYVTECIEKLEVIDRCIATTEDYRGIINLLFRMFSVNDRDSKAMVDLNRDLEALANNDLYLMSAKLSTLNIPK